ncbi:hypothetical protein [Desulfonauticus submarinus]
MVGKRLEDGKKLRILDWVRFGSILLSVENKRLFCMASGNQAASHAGNRGSNPLGDANKDTKGFYPFRG